MRNTPLKGILNAASPVKQRVADAPKPKVSKPSKKVVKKNVTPPPKKGPTTYIPKKGGGQIALTEPN